MEGDGLVFTPRRRQLLNRLASSEEILLVLRFAVFRGSDLRTLQGDADVGSVFAILGTGADSRLQYWLLVITIATDPASGELIGYWLNSDPERPLRFTKWRDDEVRIWRRSVLANVSALVQEVDGVYTIDRSTHELLAQAACDEAGYFPALQPQALSFEDTSIDDDKLAALTTNLNRAEPWRTQVSTALCHFRNSLIRASDCPLPS